MMGIGSRVHFANELLLGFGTEVAVDGGLDFEEVLDYVFEVGWKQEVELATESIVLREDTYCRPC